MCNDFFTLEIIFFSESVTVFNDQTPPLRETSRSLIRSRIRNSEAQRVNKGNLVPVDPVSIGGMLFSL